MSQTVFVKLGCRTDRVGGCPGVKAPSSVPSLLDSPSGGWFCLQAPPPSPGDMSGSPGTSRGCWITKHLLVVLPMWLSCSQLEEAVLGCGGGTLLEEPSRWESEFSRETGPCHRLTITNWPPRITEAEDSEICGWQAGGPGWPRLSVLL